MKKVTDEQLKVWREQHKDVPDQMIEDVLELRQMMEDDEVPDEQIRNFILHQCEKHGLGFGEYAVEVSTASDRLF